nr:MAG TPA: transposase DDE domain protein [Caudoviricetes sp.]
MICNKKAYSDMRKDCENCPHKQQCWSGKNVRVAYLDADIAEKVSQPLMRETMTINVGGVLTTVYKDDIEREIYKALREPFSLNFGA